MFGQPFSHLPAAEEIEALEDTARGLRLLRRGYARENQLRKGSFGWKRVRSAYAKYKELYDDQCELIPLAKESLRALFEACPRLDTVLLTTANELRATSTQCLRSFQEAMIFPFGDVSRLLWGCMQLHTMLVAASDADTKLRSLAAATVSFMFFGDALGELHKIHDAISGLENLRLDLHRNFINEDDPVDQLEMEGFLRAMKDQRLVEFFANAPNLRTLKVVAPIAEDGDDRVPLDNLLGNTVWPKLEALHVQNVECASTELLGLLRRHSITLQRLNLVDIVFREGDFESFATSIAGQLPALRKVRLRGDFVSDAQPGADFSFDPVNDRKDYDEYTLVMQMYFVKGGTFPHPEPPGVLCTSALDTTVFSIDGEADFF